MHAYMCMCVRMYASILNMLLLLTVVCYSMS